MSKNNGTGTMIIGGVERPFHVNSTRQTETFTTTMGIEYDEYTACMAQLANNKALTSQKITIVFLWSCLYAGAMLVNRPRVCDFTYDDVLDWFEAAEDSEAPELLKPLLMLSDMLSDQKKEVTSTTVMAVSKPTEVATEEEKKTLAKLQNALR